MSKKILLSYTTTAAIILFNIHSNAYAISLFSGEGENKTAPTQESYENIYALDGGKIHGKDLKIIGPSTQEESIITDISGVEARKFGSMIELEGDTTIKNVSIGLLAKESGTIKMNDGSIQVKKVHIQTPIGIAAVSNGAIILNNVEIDASNQEQSIKTIDETGIGDGTGASLKSGGTLSMTGGSIKSNYLGITLEESSSDKNKLENVKINITNLANATKESIGIRVIKTSKVTLNQVTIRHARTSIHASDSSEITISGGLIQGNHTGINVEKESVITLKNDVEVLSNDHGLSANGLHSKITMQGGKLITAGLQPAVLAGSGGEINLINVVVHIDDLTDIVMHIDDNETQTQKLELERKEAPLTTQGLQAQYAQSKITMIRGSITTTGLNPAVLAGSGGQIDLTNVPMKVHNVGLQAQAEQSKIVMTRGSITTTGMNPAVLAGSGGEIDLNDVVIKTKDIALQAQDKQSKITMRGGKLIKTGPRAAIFVTCGGQIDLLDAQLHTDSNGLAVRGRESKITLKDSEVRANILLVGKPNDEDDNGEANVIADHSILEGGARNSERKPTQIIFSLINGTTWYLKANMQSHKIQKLDLIKKLHSEVFKLNLNNSTIVFRTPREDQYQTLHIGNKSPHLTNNNTTHKTVYNATGDAKIYFNTEWNNEVPKEQQKTDRLLIHGDVSGITTIHFRNLLKGKKTKEKNTGPVNTRGLSLVQVSGKAEENSFKLANGYTTIKGLPYKYTLNAYGPTSSRGKASIEQSFVGEEEDFWDFRLQNAILDAEETISPDTQETNFFNSEEITPLNTEETASLNDGETTPLYSKKAASPDAEETISPDTQETNFFDSEEITPLNTEETASLNDGETTPLYSKKAASPDAEETISSDTQETNFFNSEEITPLNTEETASLNDGETTPLYSKKAASPDAEETISPDTQETNFFDSEEITPLNTEETASLNDGETTPLYSKKAASPDAEETISSDTQETNFFDSEEITPLNTEETASLNDGETTPLYSKKAACLNAKGKVRALVPQVASYLVMPNALFSAGLAELNNQNILLENMRTTLFEAKDKKEDNKKSGIFLSSYGHKITLSSNRSPLHYGYGADVHYTAIQAGMTLAALEGQNSTTHFGLLGTYGQLSFTPKGMEGADKSTLDKWSLAAYGNIQHNDGIYVNALFSYGAFKGNITTALIGNTAKLDGSHTVSASATIGHKLETDAKGLVFEPQAQLLYQRLMLGTLSDIDGFNVNMGKPHQWLLRIGGRLTQTIPSDEKGYATSFYGKLNLMKAFSNKSTVQIGDTFYLDAMGDSVEGGLGVNAQLSQNFALHADINYQHKLQKAGVSGINFSAGMRYQF
ncbi:autotransporter outer membrane beta-barrel domain-containing protein [Bartonella henselae]|uniref:autotransporter outer membrane beta-barrel domain-containing protein n=1 Tax=Bartonella henselae TaxID=38323 RepID=UPI001F25239C|nr:autotransporter outer membrane beta-barrel domain-containing protein [Bartonella henselae]UJM34134.1 autotransporter outer membrane beta-barrel domain-containing protein [Bartonella henselae]